MKKILFIALIPILLSCESVIQKTETKMAEEHPSPNWKSQIDSIMDFQEKAWSRSDLEAFMQPYLQSDTLLFIGSRGLTYGWKNTLNNYRKSYPNKEQMGILYFENNEYRTLGEANALVIGRWHLYRTTDTLQGSYSLNWQLIEGQWKIIADHSS